MKILYPDYRVYYLHTEMYTIITRKIFNSNIQNFNRNIPRQSKNSKRKNNKITNYKYTKLNSINPTQKISYKSFNMKSLNYSNMINSTNSNNYINTPINRQEEITKKNLSTFFIENNNINQNISSNKTYFKEEMPQYSPMKHIHNVNININNQININNNDIIAINGNKSSILIRKNVNVSKNQNKKSGKKVNKTILNSKKILVSRNKQNSLDFNSLNSFLYGNSNYTNLKKSYLSKKTNPINLLVSSNNSNIK